MKKMIIGIIIGGIIFGTIGVIAATTISSNNVTYDNKTVSKALDELFLISDKYAKVYKNGYIVYYNPVTNKKCNYNEAVSTTGTKTGCMKWYIFNDTENASTVNMILDHNTTAGVAYNSTNVNTEPKEVAIALTNDTQSWNSRLKARLITADEIAIITGNTSFSGTTSTGDSWFYFDSNNQTQIATTQGASKYSWLFDYTSACTKYGCNIADSSSFGYWTSTTVAGSPSGVWLVTRNGNLGNYRAGFADTRGIRPVITISKSIIQ